MNKAKEMTVAYGEPHEEFRIFISEPDENDETEVHLYLEGSIDKVFTGVKHFQVESPFGNDAD